jgi:hypothetical protein
MYEQEANAGVLFKMFIVFAVEVVVLFSSTLNRKLVFHVSLE